MDKEFHSSLDELKHETCSRLGAGQVFLVDLGRVSQDVRGLIDKLEAVLDESGVRWKRVIALGGIPLAVADFTSLREEPCEQTAAAPFRKDQDSAHPKSLLVAHMGLASSAICDPCRKGADICVEELTRLNPAWEGIVAIGLHKDVGDVATSIAEALVGWEMEDGVLAETIHSELPFRGLEYRHACDVARVCAEYLRCHPRVSRCFYPGLASDSSLQAARKLFHHGFGTVVDLELFPNATLLAKLSEEPLHEQAFSCELIASSMIRLSFEPSCNPREAICSLETLLRD